MKFSRRSGVPAAASHLRPAHPPRISGRHRFGRHRLARQGLRAAPPETTSRPPLPPRKINQSPALPLSVSYCAALVHPVATFLSTAKSKRPVMYQAPLREAPAAAAVTHSRPSSAVSGDVADGNASSHQSVNVPLILGKDGNFRASTESIFSTATAGEASSSDEITAATTGEVAGNARRKAAAGLHRRTTSHGGAGMPFQLEVTFTPQL